MSVVVVGLLVTLLIGLLLVGFLKLVRERSESPPRAVAAPQAPTQEATSDNDRLETDEERYLRLRAEAQKEIDGAGFERTEIDLLPGEGSPLERVRNLVDLAWKVNQIQGEHWTQVLEVGLGLKSVGGTTSMRSVLAVAGILPGSEKHFRVETPILLSIMSDERDMAVAIIDSIWAEIEQWKSQVDRRQVVAFIAMRKILLPQNYRVAIQVLLGLGHRAESRSRSVFEEIESVGQQLVNAGGLPLLNMVLVDVQGKGHERAAWWIKNTWSKFRDENC